ncbi:MAG: amidohydrolase family protein [Sulfitobacter sp.]|nr:amidohydrolase family protein [Sulfitobacter sp.]
MTDHQTIPDLLVPRALLRDADRFGGTPVQDCLRGDLVIRDGRAIGLRSTDATGPAQGLLVPPLTEPHVHLDKCHTIGRIGAHAGTLMAAIEAQSRDKQHWNEADIRARAGRGLAELLQTGVGTLRTHLDWPSGEAANQPPIGWHVLKELAEGRADRTRMEISPLVSVTDHARQGLSEHIAGMIKDSPAALGCFVYQQEDRVAGIRNAFLAAEKYGLPLDFHVDEGLDTGLDGLALIAETALELKHQGPVLCGHACSLMNLTGPDLSRRIDLIARAGLAVVALPSTNLYLQGRAQGTPDRRGITRLPELRAAGVTVALGTDNVRDAFCPLNRHDPRLTLMLGLMGLHLDPPVGDHLPLITTGARAALGLTPGYVEETALTDLRLYPVQGTADLIADAPLPRPLLLRGAHQ